MSVMTFKGYTARVEYDERDQLFVGRILGVDGDISFHATTATELQTAFERAVDDYLAEQQEGGIQPDDAESRSLRLDALMDAIAENPLPEDFLPDVGCAPLNLAHDHPDELRSRHARPSLAGVPSKFSMFAPDFMERAREEHEQSDRRSI